MNSTPPMAITHRVEVVKPGVLTTVQDLGRSGYQRHGIAVGGAMDRLALRVANMLVGNDENAAVLEATMTGPLLRFDADALVAICGATVEGIPSWQPIAVRGGETLSLARFESGCRAYLAVAGGFQVPRVMHSASTYLRAAIGGHKGRALHAGDVLETGPAGAPASWKAEHWHVSSQLLPRYSSHPTVRAIRGTQWDWFSPVSQASFFEQDFKVSSKSDRMGLRLSGEPVALAQPREMTSEPVAFGSVQVPPDGQPIVLMADRQTVGGYPKIATVVSVDLPLVAQLRPDDGVKFSEVSLAEAQALCLAEERALSRLREGLAAKWR